MKTIKLHTNSKRLIDIFQSETDRINKWFTKYTKFDDFLEHLLTISMYILSGTECTIEQNTIITWKLNYKKRYCVNFDVYKYPFNSYITNPMRIQHKKILSEIGKTLWIKVSVCPFNKKIFYFWENEKEFLQVEIIQERKPNSKSLWNFQTIYINKIREHENIENIVHIIKEEYKDVLINSWKNLWWDSPFELTII